jgi:hypothetical protein
MLLRALTALLISGLVARVFGARSATLAVSVDVLGAAVVLVAGAGLGVATLAFGALVGLDADGLTFGILYYIRLE